MDETPEESGADQAPAPAKVQLRKKALIERVAAQLGQPPASVRAVVDATLAEIAASLGRGEALVIPPLGRLSVGRIRTGKDRTAPLMVLKLKPTEPAREAPAS